ncbi:bifunctional metallophosphatase/5'-nucleotidase [Vibrio sp. 10N.286.49.B3]|uniref:bifunctional metallophosphatase/5'-nucleotidase n=1 Tax=Vibrio sp. 10N.286.49.B3 TaxID=1880855 RepID=UPI000C856E6B|nr:bifunctional UDP-sugar hydrolase/5'-nucleotidase [Vibrio sp. 10N.286.49.B3]PMH41402.1 bifunctional metallophosphatase/5'-nucleotidase [Vibrio sp. 10N.286.49.B3]
MMNKYNKAVTITLAHINDTHSYFEPTSLQLSLEVAGSTINPYVSAGGFARIATRAKQLKQIAQEKGQDFLFLHAGDCFQGTLYFSLFKGQANVDMLNGLDLDAMVLGNHELDMGNEPVAQFTQHINFPLLAGNWDLSQENQDKAYTLDGQPQVKSYQPDTQSAAYIIKNIQDEQVAIFGLSIDKMSDIANPDPDTPFIDSIATAKATIKQINQQGVNKIILLSHLGYEADLALAEQVEGIGLIVGGHSHRLQGDFSALGLTKDDPYGVKVNQTYIVQAGLHALTLGHCEITFSAQGEVTHFTGRNELLLGRRLFIDSMLSRSREENEDHRLACEFLAQHPHVVVCKKDPALQSILTDTYMPKVRELQQHIIAYADSPLRHVRIPDAGGESQLAPIVAESFYFQMNQLGYDVEFAIHNAGGVRNSLNEGAVSVADIAGKLLPFAVPIGIYDIDGQAIADALEGAINNATNNGIKGTGSGSYPYTHNLQFEYHADRPQGERITDLKINHPTLGWCPVDPAAIYRGTSSAYTMKGKEGYDALLNMQGEGVVTTSSMSECMVALLTQNPQRLNQQNRHALQKYACVK